MAGFNEKTNEAIDGVFFQQKILQAIEKRKAFFENEDTTAFRVFNGEGDGIGGVTIDYFDGYYVINWYSKGIYQFKEEIIQSITSSFLLKASTRKRGLM